MENKEFQTLIASIVIHIALIMLLLHAKVPDNLFQENVPVEIVFEDPSKPKQTFVTETDEKEELMDKLKSQAAYLSKLSKRVKQETVARRDGLTANRMRKLNLNPTNQNLGQKIAGRQTPQVEQGEMNMRKMQQQSGGLGRNIAIGDSSIGEYIPNVKEGNFTALNTDQFTFYTFFSRVNEAIRFRWVSRVRDFADHLPPLKQQELAQYARTTYVTIILDSKGSIIRSFISRKSGSDGLDQAALLAFREAAPFLNPPAEMREPDGSIRLDYSFHVEFRPNALAGP